MGLINDIPTCEDLLKRIESEAESAINRISALVVPKAGLGNAEEKPGPALWGIGQSKL